MLCTKERHFWRDGVQSFFQLSSKAHQVSCRHLSIIHGVEDCPEIPDWVQVWRIPWPIPLRVPLDEVVTALLLSHTRLGSQFCLLKEETPSFFLNYLTMVDLETGRMLAEILFPSPGVDWHLLPTDVAIMIFETL